MTRRRLLKLSTADARSGEPTNPAPPVTRTTSLIGSPSWMGSARAALRGRAEPAAHEIEHTPHERGQVTWLAPHERQDDEDGRRRLVRLLGQLPPVAVDRG